MSRQGGIRELVPAKWKKAPKQRHYILKSSCRENEKWLAKNIQNKIPFFFFQDSVTGGQDAVLSRGPWGNTCPLLQ